MTRLFVTRLFVTRLVYFLLYTGNNLYYVVVVITGSIDYSIAMDVMSK